jgi:hypothetical protein
MEQDALDQDSWIAFGFLREPPSTSQIHTGGGGVIWALTRNLAANDNQVLHENVSGGTGSSDRGNYVTGATIVPMSLVLDTTGGTGAWTYDWIVDGTPRISDRSLGSAFESVIGAVGISKISGSTAKTFEAFRLVRE